MTLPRQQSAGSEQHAISQSLADSSALHEARRGPPPRYLCCTSHHLAPSSALVTIKTPIAM
jgi:hypothetical protein